MQNQKLSRSAWAKTPYAGSTAKHTEKSFGELMSRYEIGNYQWTQGSGPHSRQAIMFRFEYREKRYRIKVETLHADASPEELLLQAKHAIFHYLKSTLEMVSVFWPLEKAMFAFLELPNSGLTIYEAAQPSLLEMKSPDFGRLMLPGPER